MAMFAAAPAPTVTTLDLTEVSVAALKSSTRGPNAPVMARFVNAACPLAMVLIVVVPPTVPPPEKMEATMLTPAELTGLSPTSVICTTGCGESGAPAVADAPGCVVSSSFAAGPVTIGRDAGVSDEIPGALKVNVADPIAPTYGGKVNVAIPAASVVAETATVVLPGSDTSVAVTNTPACGTGLFVASMSRTKIGAIAPPTEMFAGNGCTSANFDALPAVPVAENVTLSAPDDAVSVLAPAVPPSVHEPTVAMPKALVVAFSVVALPPPLATAKTTATPATGLPPTSLRVTLGATATGVPAVALCKSPVFF